jgi:hypothetical protein
VIRTSRSRAVKILAGITLAGVVFCLLAFLWIKLEPAVRGCKSVSSAGRSVKVIFHSGRYCLLSDLNWDKSGAPIVISKSNIIFDLNGFAIRGNEKQPDQVGILLSDGVEGVSIENGSIESVQVGIRAQEVRDVRISGVKFSSISWVGVQLNGYAGQVQNSHFFDVGVRNDGGDGDAYAVAIMAGGEKFTIENNRFENVIRQPAPKEQEGEGVSIIISENSSDFKIRNNIFANPSNLYSNDIGIWVRGKNMLIDSNKFSSVKRPIAGKFDEVNYLLGNEFNFMGEFVSTDDGWIKHAAVAVNLTNSSLMVIKNNSFSGYSCPIQAFSEQPRHLALDADNNSAVWPVGGKSCLSGVWHSDEINWPEQPK